jgi:hypothetical protein
MKSFGGVKCAMVSQFVNFDFSNVAPGNLDYLRVQRIIAHWQENKK